MSIWTIFWKFLAIYKKRRKKCENCQNFKHFLEGDGPWSDPAEPLSIFARFKKSTGIHSYWMHWLTKIERWFLIDSVSFNRLVSDSVKSMWIELERGDADWGLKSLFGWASDSFELNRRIEKNWNVCSDCFRIASD